MSGSKEFSKRNQRIKRNGVNCYETRTASPRNSSNALWASVCYNLTTERFVVPQKTEKFDLKALVKGWLSNRALLGIIGLSIGTIFFLLAYFLKVTNVWIFVVLYGLGYTGVFVIGLICWAMITDVIDDMEVQTGTREDGNVYSVYSFSRKMGQALGTGLCGWTLSAIGYTQATQFDADVTLGIYNATCLLPAIAFGLSLIFLIWLYPLSREKVEENAHILAERREQTSEVEPEETKGDNE